MGNVAKQTKDRSPLRWGDIDDIFNDPTEAVPTAEVFDRLVERQFEKYGEHIETPCAEARELLDQWAEDCGKSCLHLWHAACARLQPRLEAVGIGPCVNEVIDTPDAKGLNSAPRINDAELLGSNHDDMQELLAKPFVCMTGKLYGQKDRRNTQDGAWKRVEMPLLDWIKGAGKGKNSWGFSRHPESKLKEGTSVVLADAIEGARTDSAIQTMYAVGLDIDSGASLDAVIDKLEELGVFALVYTSHSHGKSSLVLKHDDIMRKLKLDKSPNRTQIQQYMRLHHKDRYDEGFIDTIEIEDVRKQTKDGLRTTLKTAPLDKFRVILPLWEPVELADLGSTVNQWKDAWADAVCGVSVNMLGINFDATCSDVNRLFFTPRHPKDGEYYSAVVQGRPLRYEEIVPHSKARYIKERGPSDPFAAVGGDLGGEPKREQFTTDDNLDLNKWHRGYKERWNAADAIESFCSDKVRVAGGEKAGTVHLECPFEHEHSSEGGTATMAMNPEENEAGYWTIFCRHDACQGRDKLEFIKAMVDDKWLDASVLTDEDWCVPIADDETDCSATLRDVSPSNDERSKIYLVIDNEMAGVLPEVSVLDLTKTCTKLIKRPDFDENAQAYLVEKVARRTHLGKITAKKLVKEALATNKGSLKLKKKRKKGAPPEIDLDDNQHRSAVDAAFKIMTDASDDPKLFHNGGRLTEIRTDEYETLSIASVSSMAFKARLEEHIDFTRDDKNVQAPQAIANAAYHKPFNTYPPLFRITTFPTYSAKMALIMTDGYHPESGLYHKRKTSVPIQKVAASPTPEEVSNAVELLVDLFADFPLDAMTRGELFKAVQSGTDVPSLCHILSAALTSICRDMIDGPTPNHLGRKDKPRVGATKIMGVASKIGTFDFAKPQSLPDSRSEVQKTIIASLDSGGSYVFFDNLPTGHENESDELAAAITAWPFYTGRRLGHTEMVTVKVSQVWISTGIRTQLSEQLAERTLLIDLDPQMETPGDRPTSSFKYNMDSYLPANVGKYTHALLVLVQNWISKGCPKWKGQALGGFESHAGVIGGILDAAGIYGFMGNREKLKSTVQSENPETEFLDALIEEYHSPLSKGREVLFRAWGDQPAPKSLKNDGERVSFEYADARVVSIKDVLNREGIAQKGWGYVVNEEGKVSYPDKARKTVPQKIATLTSTVREWRDAQTEIEQRQGRYVFEKVHKDQFGVMYRFIRLPLIG